MIITHQITDFLFDLFPKAKDLSNSIDILKQEIIDYYTISVFQPVVIVNGNINTCFTRCTIRVEVDI
jgi:hypothetical protein